MGKVGLLGGISNTPFRKVDVKPKPVWRAAKDLKPGDKVILKDGSTGTVQSIKPVKKLHTVYNFAVEEDHTYFVSEAGVLVHNQYNAAEEVTSDPKAQVNTVDNAIDEARRLQKILSDTSNSKLRARLQGKMQEQFNTIALYADTPEQAAEIIGKEARWYERQRHIETALSYRKGAEHVVQTVTKLTGQDLSLESFRTNILNTSDAEQTFWRREIWKVGTLLDLTTDKYYGGRYTSDTVVDIYFDRPVDGVGDISGS